MFRSGAKYAGAALLLAGSAALLFSCERKEVRDDAARAEAVRTEYSENLTIVKSENGRKMYHFTTPLLEGYTEARDPYREFRKGVRIVTYKNDSLASEDARLRANYAIFYSERNLWEVKGNVLFEAAEAREIYTEQLFWNAKTKRIYSNVDTKIVQNGGRDVFYGEGLESDDALRDWRFRKMTGRMEVHTQPAADSLATPAAGAGAPVRSAAAESRRGAGDGTEPASVFPRSSASGKRIGDPEYAPRGKSAPARRTQPGLLSPAPEKGPRTDDGGTENSQR